MYYRMGLFEHVEQVGKRLEGYFKKMGVKKMIIPCTAGYNMFTNVLPAFDVKFDFEVEHLLPRIWNKIERGEIKFTSKVEKVATIQDSCYGKVVDGDILELPRKLLEAVGVEVVEMKNSGRTSPCCGIGAGFSSSSSFHPFSIQGASAQRLKEAKKTGADILVTYCAGCLLMFSVAKILYPTRMPVYHLLEILQMAIGEKPLRRQASRARKLFLGVVRHQFPKLLSWKRFHLEEIQPM
jgi:Fe-S oxidoreductase